MAKFKIGDRVVGTQRKSIDGKTGTIRHINGQFGVEFDESMGGHDGGYWKTLGKNGHCWNCEPHEIKLISTEPIYEIF